MLETIECPDPERVLRTLKAFQRDTVDYVFRRVRDFVHDSKDPKDDIIKKAFWTYTTAEDLLREISGRAVRDIPGTDLKAGDLVSRTGDLKPDGSTASGSWIYAGVFSKGQNLSKRRDSRTDPGNLGIYPNFGWTWPNNMRVLYNRASCDRHGRPYAAVSFRKRSSISTSLAPIPSTEPS